MARFTRTRRSRFPADMLQRLETFGRYEFDARGSGIDGTRVWDDCVAPFTADARADPDGFLTDLRALIAHDRNGFVTFGAARLAWEIHSSECLNLPAALPLIDAGIDFILARGLPTAHLTGFEMSRLVQRREQAG